MGWAGLAKEQQQERTGPCSLVEWESDQVDVVSASWPTGSPHPSAQSTFLRADRNRAKPGRLQVMCLVSSIHVLFETVATWLGVFRSTIAYIRAAEQLSVVNVAGLLRVIKSMSLFKWLFLHGQTTIELHTQSALWQRFFLHCALKFIARLYRYFH